MDQCLINDRVVFQVISIPKMTMDNYHQILRYKMKRPSLTSCKCSSRHESRQNIPRQSSFLRSRYCLSHPQGSLPRCAYFWSQQHPLVIRKLLIRRNLVRSRVKMEAYKTKYFVKTNHLNLEAKKYLTHATFC